MIVFAVEGIAEVIISVEDEAREALGTVKLDRFVDGVVLWIEAAIFNRRAISTQILISEIVTRSTSDAESAVWVIFCAVLGIGNTETCPFLKKIPLNT